ncbi:MAG: hypothetical protein AAGC93_29395 [Cyanobacteria bacterium P01_F01_bin.53]
MLNIPFVARGFAIALCFLALCLAGENTIISAEVLSSQSGATALSSSVIAVGCTGLEIAFTSWMMQGKSMVELIKVFKKSAASTFFRLFIGSAILVNVYVFDIKTTYMHPQFISADTYFFIAVVCSYVFGPEILLLIGWWLWNKARDQETEYMAATNHRAAENAYRKSERERLVAMAEQAGRAHADARVSQRWGPAAQSPLQ